MNLVLNLLIFSASAAFAQGPRVQILVAQRYVGESSRILRQRIARLADLRSPGEYEIVDISPKRPIIGGKTSLLAEVRKRVLATSVHDKLNLHVVIDSHGSPTAVHSRRCEPVSYEDLASTWRALMQEFVEKGYRTENLSFDLIFHFCYSGNFTDLLGATLPFDTLIINSAQRDHLALNSVLNDMFERTVAAYAAASASRVELRGSRNDQELLSLLLNHIFKIDLRTGRTTDDSVRPPPEIQWWPAANPRTDDDLSELAGKLFEVYVYSLYHRDTHLRFTNNFRYVVNHYITDALARGVQNIAVGLTDHGRTIHGHLFFHHRLDNDIAPSELTKHFNTMLAIPNQNVRDAVAWDLMMIGDMVENADHHFAHIAELDLAEDTPSIPRLLVHLDVLREYKTPVAAAICGRLLETLDRLNVPPKTGIDVADIESAMMTR